MSINNDNDLTISINEQIKSILVEIENGSNIYSKGLIGKYLLALLKVKVLEQRIFHQDWAYINSELDKIIEGLVSNEKDSTEILKLLTKCLTFVVSIYDK
jgi:hypothetical protein